MTVDEVTALMKWNVAMYANCAKPLSEENAATQIMIWAAELMLGRKLCARLLPSASFP